MCAWCMSVLPLPAEVTRRSRERKEEGGVELCRNVVLSRFPVTWISCLCEAEFTHKGNNEVREWNPADDHTYFFTFKSLHTVLCIIICPSSIHLLIRFTPGVVVLYFILFFLIFSFSVYCRSFFFYRGNERLEKTVRQTEAEKKWRTHHQQSCHSLVYALTG